MNTLIHLCKKDFAFSRSWLIGAWVSLVFMAILPAILPGTLFDEGLILLVITATPMLLVFATTLQIMRGDSFVGSTGFMETRPATRVRLLGSKLASTAVFILIPAVLSALLGGILLLVELSPADCVLLVLEKTLLFGLAASVALLIGTFTRGIGLATLLTVALGILLVWLFTSIHGMPGAFNFLEEAVLLKASRWLVMEALVLVCAVSITGFWCFSRRPGWTVFVALLVSILSVSTGFHWGGNFVSALTSDVSEEPAATKDARLEWLGEPTISGGSNNNVRFVTVSRPAKISGLNGNWFGHIAAYHAEARFADGTTISSQQTFSRGYGDFTLPLLPSLGVELPEGHPSRFSSGEGSPGFACEVSKLRNLTDRRTSITGKVMVDLYQPIVLADLPATSGASIVHGRFRYRINRIDGLEGQITFSLSILGVPLTSRGDTLRGFGDDLEIIVVDSNTGEHTVPGGSGGSTRLGGGGLVMNRHVRIDDRPPGKKVSEPDAFLKSARLYIIGRNYGGTISLPYEIPEMTLEEKR